MHVYVWFQADQHVKRNAELEEVAAGLQRELAEERRRAQVCLNFARWRGHKYRPAVSLALFFLSAPTTCFHNL